MSHSRGAAWLGSARSHFLLSPKSLRLKKPGGVRSLNAGPLGAKAQWLTDSVLAHWVESSVRSQIFIRITYSTVYDRSRSVGLTILPRDAVA